MICRDAPTRKPTQELLYTLNTRFTKEVLVILIEIFQDLIALYLSADIWIGLDMGKYVQYIIYV